MKEYFLKPFSFLLLRTPLQNLKDAYSLYSEASPLFQEGLYLASPEFWREFQKEGFPIKSEKIKHSFSKYWLRSSSRCTPYGTFAGSTFINITDDDTNLILKNIDQHIRYLRLDMNYMANLITAVSKMPKILEQIYFYTNNSVYVLPDNIRYVEYIIRDNVRHYHLASLEKTSYLTQVLERAGNGATIHELISLILQIEDVTEEEAQDYILSLWDSQVIISELEPCVTGQEPLDRFIEQISSLENINELVLDLKKIQRMIKYPQVGVAFYQIIERKLKEIDSTHEVPKNTLQVDLVLSTQQNNINQLLIKNILDQVSDLMMLARKSVNTDLNNFKAKFSSRFEESEVPLNIALDADIGIGYAGIDAGSAGGGILIDDLLIRGTNAQVDSSMDYIVQFTLSKYYDFLKNKRPFIELHEDELKSYKSQIKDFSFPDSMYVMGDLLKKEGRIDTENFLFDLSGFGGPSGGSLLGRFAHSDEQIFLATKKVLEQEELIYPDMIFAEIAHLPQARIGNILLRPILRKYEIPFVGKSGISKENQISVDDLMVSIKNNEVVLRSKSLNKRIIPRLTTAHNFGSRSLPLYKFLCDLQGQGKAYPNIWDWGHLNMLKHLPRVIYKNIIVRKARWKIDERDINDLPKNTSEYQDYFKSFCEKWSIPERVVYKENDNELLIDFKEEMGVSLFMHYLKKHKNIQVDEFVFNEENCIVKDVNGNPFTNEIIIPVSFTNLNRPQAVTTYKFTTVNNISLKRKFSIYSEWLYFKIYCGPQKGEEVLRDIILPFIESGMEKKMFEHFFFIRFKDDDNHLRIRFYNRELDRQLLIQKELMQALQPSIDNGFIQKVISDTYSREIERYEENLMEDAEQLFFYDSIAVLRFIKLLEVEGKTEKYKLLFALRGIDILLCDFGLSTNEKLELSKQMQAKYFKEFGGSLDLQKQLNDKYRKYQQSIFSHMDSTQDAKNEIEGAVAIFQNRSVMNNSVINRILTKISSEYEGKLFRLLPSYIHMSMNRMFIAQCRKYELVAYHFLERYYTSKSVIENKRKTANNVI